MRMPALSALLVAACAVSPGFRGTMEKVTHFGGEPFMEIRGASYSIMHPLNKDGYYVLRGDTIEIDRDCRAWRVAPFAPITATAFRK